MAAYQVFLSQHLYLSVIIGVLLGIALPLLRSLLPSPPAAAAALANAGGLWTELRPFVVIGAFSVLTAILVLAFAGDAVNTWKWHQALLAGYAWDSTLLKCSDNDHNTLRKCWIFLLHSGPGHTRKPAMAMTRREEAK